MTTFTPEEEQIHTALADLQSQMDDLHGQIYDLREQQDLIRGQCKHGKIRTAHLPTGSTYARCEICDREWWDWEGGMPESVLEEERQHANPS